MGAVRSSAGSRAASSDRGGWLCPPTTVCRRLLQDGRILLRSKGVQQGSGLGELILSVRQPVQPCRALVCLSMLATTTCESVSVLHW
jgi:hypothetical protein